MRISDRLTRIKPSATLAVNAKALELKAKGVQVVSLAVGDTPEHVREAAKTAIDEGFTRYTQVPGIPELRQAVCGYFARFYGVEAPMEATVVTNGGKQALYNLFQCLLNPGDEVLVPAPYWVSYPALVELAGGVTVPVASPAERGFKVTPEELDRAVTPRTRALLLNSPSNPTGACYSRAETDAIMEWAIARDLFVISDEIYDRLVYEPAEAVSVCDWWERHPENVAVVNGLAKTFAMTGWRVGYALAHPDLIKAMTKIQGQSTSNICSSLPPPARPGPRGGFVVAGRGLPQARRRVLPVRGHERPVHPGPARLGQPVHLHHGAGQRGAGAGRGLWRRRLPALLVRGVRRHADDRAGQGRQGPVRIASRVAHRPRPSPESTI